MKIITISFLRLSKDRIFQDKGDKSLKASIILTPKIRTPSTYGMTTADKRYKSPNKYWRLKSNSYIAQSIAKSKYAPAAIVYRMTERTRATTRRLELEVRERVILKYKHTKVSVTKNAIVVMK